MKSTLGLRGDHLFHFELWKHCIFAQNTANTYTLDGQWSSKTSLDKFNFCTWSEENWNVIDDVITDQYLLECDRFPLKIISLFLPGNTFHISYCWLLKLQHLKVLVSFSPGKLPGLQISPIPQHLNDDLLPRGGRRPLLSFALAFHHHIPFIDGIFSIPTYLESELSQCCFAF